MHELPVAESMLEIVERHARQAGASRVTDLHLVLGQLSSIVDDSIQFYWDLLSAGTIAEGSRLHFRRIPAEMLCLECGQRFGVGDGTLACPTCDSGMVQVVAGEEFHLEAIDAEFEEDPSSVVRGETV